VYNWFISKSENISIDLLAGYRLYEIQTQIGTYYAGGIIIIFNRDVTVISNSKN